MVQINCPDVNTVCWAWVTEYARRRRIKRCKALENIIEEHIKFTKFAYDMMSEKDRGKKKKK